LIAETSFLPEVKKSAELEMNVYKWMIEQLRVQYRLPRSGWKPINQGWFTVLPVRGELGSPHK
jgi:hypothetical protein